MTWLLLVPVVFAAGFLAGFLAGSEYHWRFDCQSGRVAGRRDELMTHAPVWIVRGFIGVRVGRRYFKLRDIRRHPLLFSERNGYGYRRVFRVGRWEMGVRS